MATSYTYSLTTDFGGNIRPRKLHTSIDNDVGITPNINGITLSADDVDIEFASALSAGEQTTLNGLVSAHVGSAADPVVSVTTAGNDDTTATIKITQTGNRIITLPDATDTLVGEAITQTLQNKKLVTSNTEVVDNIDSTKKLKFDTSAANASTSLTLKCCQTGNRTIELPDTDDTLVGMNSSQNITNKNLIDSSVNFVDNVDNTKKIAFSIGGSDTSTTTTISSNQTANRTITLPDATDTVVTETFTQVLTNKTLTDSSTYIQDNSDNTKKIIFQLSGITTGTTRTITIPDENITLVGIGATQTLTNKTLTTPIISTISNTGTLTLPTSTDTLVARSTTDTLTNKTFGDNLNMNSNKITNLATPTLGSDATTKDYVDGVATGLDIKKSVVVGTTVDLDSNSSISGVITYTTTGGTSSRGQITATLAVTDTFTVDGINFGAAQDGSRILLKDQATGAQNGIWTTTVSGTSLTLDRATDFDSDAEVTSGAFTFVEQGTSNDNNGYSLSTNDPIIIGGASGTTLTFSQFSGAGQITAGSGLTKAGNTINAIGSTTIVSNADSLEVNSSATANQILLSSGSAGTASTFGSLPLGDSNAVSGTLAVANGGTGVATITSGNFVQGNGTSAITATKAVPTGVVVGTSDAQTLTNKTINTASNTITVATGDVTSGTFVDARIAASNVTQHQASIDHGSINGLLDDDHTQYALLAGRSGGQTLKGGTLASNDITIDSTSHVTKGNIILNDITLSKNRMVINDQGYATTYSTSIQSGNISTWLEILNNGGTNKGVFFGIGGNNFELWSYQGGDIMYYVDPVATNGTVKFTMQADGIFRVHDLGLGIAKTDATGKFSSETENTAFNKNFGSSAGTITEGNHIGTATGVHGVSGSVVGTTDTQTLTNKTLTTPTIQTNLITTGSYIEFADIYAPANPGASKGRLYKKTGDDGIFWKPDAAGPEVDLTDSGTTLPTTTKGDIIVHNGTTDTRLAVGANDLVLTADSAQSTGITWKALTSATLACLQVRNNASIGLSGTLTDVTFNMTDIETDASVLEHNNTNTDRIDIKVAGKYLITAHGKVQDGTIQVRINDTTVIPGSKRSHTGSAGDRFTLSSICIADLAASDFISLQASGNNSLYTSTVMTVTKLDGVQGPQGNTGATGAAGTNGTNGSDGDITWQGTWSSVTAYTTNQAVIYLGTSYVCILGHTNQVPPNVTYWDILASKGDAGGSDNLATTGTNVDVGASSPPVTGQVLKATSATTATWQTPAITNSKVSATTTTSVTSSTYTVMNTMTTTPAAGTYFVSFSASGRGSGTSANNEYAIFKAGTIIQLTHRMLNEFAGSAGSDYVSAMHSQDIITVNGSEAIDIRYKTNSGTFSVYERSIILLKM